MAVTAAAVAGGLTIDAPAHIWRALSNLLGI
jgi:hypothetical protein